MTKCNSYEIDFINSKIIITKKFYKAASTLNTPEYAILLQLRTDNPGFTFEPREIRHKEGKQSYRNLTYKHMEEFIIAREGKDSESLKELEKVKKLSQIQAGPYAYVKTWFLKKYKDEFETKEDAGQRTEGSDKVPDLKLIKQN